MIKEKEKAPFFELNNSEGEKVRLEDFREKPVVLYFYPKDDTPGCTTEACNFRDDYSEINKLGVEIIGISPDSERSHTKFIEKYKLPFTLLADENHKVCELYGVWALKKSFGREYFGVKRTTFLIYGDGNIAKVFKNVKPTDHSKEVIEQIKELLA